LLTPLIVERFQNVPINGDREDDQPDRNDDKIVRQHDEVAADIAVGMDRERASTQEVLAGLVERVTYHNTENGFCVIRIKARGYRELVTAVGHAAAIAAGEWVTASGEWVNDRTHGQQFKSRFMRTSAPTTTEGIEKYLGSGMIRGIGPVYAEKMVKAFGEKVFDVIEAEPHRLREVTGIGPMRAKRITGAWAEQKIVREIMVFLHGHGVGTARAVRIFKTYGADAVQVMTENPYRQAHDWRRLADVAQGQFVARRPKLGALGLFIFRMIEPRAVIYRRGRRGDRVRDRSRPQAGVSMFGAVANPDQAVRLARSPIEDSNQQLGRYFPA
jgi:ATP-dependent exoDNAse (exonuclease V) alpha subunit